MSQQGIEILIDRKLFRKHSSDMGKNLSLVQIVNTYDRESRNVFQMELQEEDRLTNNTLLEGECTTLFHVRIEEATYSNETCYFVYLRDLNFMREL